MRNHLFALLTFATCSQTFGQVAYDQVRCSPQEQSSIAAQAERATLEKVRQDIRAEGRVQATALGYDDRDCLDRAQRQVQEQRYRAIDECVRQTVYFRSCDVTDVRTVRAPSRIEAVSGSGSIDDYETTEHQCRQNAQNRALQSALEKCQRTYNRACRIVSGPTTATHEIERRRRYGIAGPKEDFHKCYSSAQAIPDSREQIQCTVELVAKIRVL